MATENYKSVSTGGPGSPEGKVQTTSESIALNLVQFRPADSSSDTNSVPPVNSNRRDPDFLVNEEKSPLAVDAIENTMLQNNASYVTDLGYTLDLDKKLTLRDLGQHMTERMLESMSQENLNRGFGTTALGRSSVPSKSKTEDDPITNIFKSLFTSQSTDAEKNLYIPENNDFENMMKSRYGDYLSDLADYKSYVANQCKGLAMGEANVVNPPFMFNELDDVRSDFRRPFIGRTYSEEIYDYNMPIVYFQPGLVKIDTAGVKFMSGLINRKTERYQNFLRGDGGAIKWAASHVGAGANAILSFGSKTILDKAQWYKWIPTVSKYLHFVNDLLLELATWMGLIGGNYGSDDKERIFNQAFQTDIEKMKTMDEGEYKSMSEAFGNDSPNPNNPLSSEDIDEANSVDTTEVATLEAKTGYMGGTGDEKSTLSALRCIPLFNKPEHKPDSGAWEDPDDDSIIGLTKLVEIAIPFAMDKGAQSSETFSNSTQQHPLVDQYNQMYEESNRNSMGGVGVNGVQDVMKQGKDIVSNVAGFAIQKGKDIINNVGASLGLSSEAGMIAGGLGRFMLPEVWSDSSFDKSYSISMKLRSPYGHRLSIFENEFVPLSFLIALTASRKIGLQSYTNPFYVKMFAKGLFSVPMGMITSLSISRGEDSNDRTVEGFFRTTSINISVKDVLPQMAVGLGGGEMSIMNASNLGMNNYIFTLCGIDFVERANLLKMFSHKWDKLKSTVMAYDPTGLIGDAATGRSNLLFEVSNTFAGRNISRTLQSVGKSANPYSTETPKTYY